MNTNSGNGQTCRVYSNNPVLHQYISCYVTFNKPVLSYLSLRLLPHSKINCWNNPAGINKLVFNFSAFWDFLLGVHFVDFFGGQYVQLFKVQTVRSRFERVFRVYLTDISSVTELCAVLEVVPGSVAWYILT
jgi:hypothetical protein